MTLKEFVALSPATQIAARAIAIADGYPAEEFEELFPHAIAEYARRGQAAADAIEKLQSSIIEKEQAKANVEAARWAGHPVEHTSSLVR